MIRKHKQNWQDLKLAQSKSSVELKLRLLVLSLQLKGFCVAMRKLPINPLKFGPAKIHAVVDLSWLATIAQARLHQTI